MSQPHESLATKPHIRKIFGYWRVSAVPVKWDRLPLLLKKRWKAAHDFVDRKNREEHSGKAA